MLETLLDILKALFVLCMAFIFIGACVIVVLMLLKYV